MTKEELIRSKSFCIMPWIHLSTEPSGDVKICCLANKTLNKEDGTTYNLGNDSVNDIFNSKQLVNNRRDMMNGIKIPDCSHCWKEEAAGGLSQRISNTKYWLDKNSHLIDYINKSIEQDYVAGAVPSYYDFRFGNLCNLKCRSCGSLNSTQINKEYTELKHKHWLFTEAGSKYESLNDWYQTDTFKNNIYNNLERIEKLYITGGEPTLIEENYELMRKLIEIGRAKDVSIMFNTNMTNLKDEFYQLISQFRHAEIAISVEGYGDIQEYLRYPSKWKQIDANIRKIAELPRTISIFAVPVVQSVNLEYITDFWKYIDSINKEYGFYRIRLLPIILDFPTMLDLSILPLDYKKQCWNKIEKFMPTTSWFLDDPFFVGRYNNIKDKCLKDNYNEELLKQFKTFTDILDENRNQNLKDVNPKVYEIINNVK